MKRIILIAVCIAVGIKAATMADIDWSSESFFLEKHQWEMVSFSLLSLAFFSLATYFINKRIFMLAVIGLLTAFGIVFLTLDGLVNWPYVELMGDTPVNYWSIAAIIIGIELIVLCTSFHEAIPYYWDELKAQMKGANYIFLVVSFCLTAGMMLMNEITISKKNDPSIQLADSNKKIAEWETLKAKFEKAGYLTWNPLSCQDRSLPCEDTVAGVTKKIQAEREFQKTFNQNKKSTVMLQMGFTAAVILQIIRALVLVYGGSLMLSLAAKNLREFIDHPPLRPPSEWPQRLRDFRAVLVEIFKFFPTQQLLAAAKNTMAAAANILAGLSQVAKNAATSTINTAIKWQNKEPLIESNIEIEKPVEEPQKNVADLVEEKKKKSQRAIQKRNSDDWYFNIHQSIAAGHIKVKSQDCPTIVRAKVREYFDSHATTLDAAVKRWNEDANELGTELLKKHNITTEA